MKTAQTQFIGSVIVGSMLVLSAQAQNNPSPLARKLPPKTVQAGKLGTDIGVPPEASTQEPLEADMTEPTLMNVYSAELYQIKKMEEAERNAALARDKTSKTQAYYEQQVDLHRRKLEEFKRRQEQITSEIQAMQTEVADYQKKSSLVANEYDQAEQKHEDFLVSLEKERANLEELRSKYQAALAALTERHEQTKRNINTAMIQIHRIKTELANSATENDALQAQTEIAVADEMKTRAEWIALKSQMEDMKAEKNKRLAERNEAQKKYELALSDQRMANNEYLALQKTLAEASRKTAEDVRKLDEASLSAQRSKVLNDSNRIKAEAEIEKLQTYVALVKKSNLEVVSAQKESETKLVSTQMALEAARSELGMNVALGDQINLRKTKEAAQARSIASVETSDSILPDARTWVIRSNCQVRERPRSASESVGEVTVGQRIPASVGPGQWVKVLSTGHTAYIRTECGSFE